MDVNYSPWHRILITIVLVFSLRIQLSVCLFVHNYIAQLDFGFCLDFYLLESFFYLGCFDVRHCAHLAWTNSITVKDNTIWVGTIHLFELIESFGHEHFHLEAYFLSYFRLDDSLRPIFSRWSVISRNKANYALTVCLCFMECIHTTDHNLFVKQRKIVNDPRYTTNFCTNLRQDFSCDWFEISSKHDRSCQNNLWHNWALLQRDSLQLSV